MKEDDAVFHAMADPTRRLLLDELAERDGQTLYELVARLIMKHNVGMTRQAIGKHLRILRDAGLVRVERRGKFKMLTFDASPIRRVEERWIQKLVNA